MITANTYSEEWDFRPYSPAVWGDSGHPDKPTSAPRPIRNVWSTWYRRKRMGVGEAADPCMELLADYAKAMLRDGGWVHVYASLDHECRWWTDGSSSYGSVLEPGEENTCDYARYLEEMGFIESLRLSCDAHYVRLTEAGLEKLQEVGCELTSKWYPAYGECQDYWVRPYDGYGHLARLINTLKENGR